MAVKNLFQKPVYGDAFSLLFEYSTLPAVINKKLSIKTNKSAAIKHENASARGKSFLLLLACAFSADMSSR